MATIVVFGSSFVLAIFLFLAKAIELRRDSASFVLRPLNSLNDRAERLALNMKFRLLQIIQTVRYICLVHLPALADRTVEGAKEKVLREVEARRKVIMGHKDIVSKGSASFFLKKIDENKKNGEKGEINDSL